MYHNLWTPPTQIVLVPKNLHHRSYIGRPGRDSNPQSLPYPNGPELQDIRYYDIIDRWLGHLQQRLTIRPPGRKFVQTSNLSFKIQLNTVYKLLVLSRILLEPDRPGTSNSRSQHFRRSALPLHSIAQRNPRHSG